MVPAPMKAPFRNIAIIAHVDHGKTTLVDRLLQTAGTFRSNQAVQERAMDSMDLEREKGITIKAKNASVHWNDLTINIVDTPGHADFGGEVERILKMVDGVLLLVDAADGPQAQTRFVLRKAIENGLKILVFINKIDRETANPAKVHDQVLELLLELNATEEQFNAPFLYGSAKNGIVLHEPDGEVHGFGELFDTIVKHVPAPEANVLDPFHMLVSNLDWSDYVGRIGVGKVIGGTVKVGDSIVCIHKDGRKERAKVSKLFTYAGMGTSETNEAVAGNIVGVAGFADVFIGETLCDSEERAALPSVEIDPPTIRMQFCVNDGPFAGKDGKYVTSRQVGDRLKRETRTNVSLKVEDTELSGTFDVSARGELQIAIIAETMRREGYEMLISRPEVIYRAGPNGEKHEPFENLWLEIPERNLGDTIQALAGRKGQITHMEHLHGRVLLEAVICTRGLIGFESWLTNTTSGEGICSHMFKEYAPVCGEIPSRNTGAIVSSDTGWTTAYALDTIQERGRMFVGAGEEVYEGMVIGENSRTEDLPANPTRMKPLTNMRASGSDKNVILEPATKMSLERCIEFISADEFVEATPNFLRLRKKVLDPTKRKRMNSKANL